ncbi:hypothetical protein ACFL9U_01055 [Thermodesulfobacteriota bacterium]
MPGRVFFLQEPLDPFLVKRQGENNGRLGAVQNVRQIGRRRSALQSLGRGDTRVNGPGVQYQVFHDLVKVFITLLFLCHFLNLFV